MAKIVFIVNWVKHIVIENIKQSYMYDILYQYNFSNNQKAYIEDDTCGLITDEGGLLILILLLLLEQ